MILPIYKPNHEYLGEHRPSWWVLSKGCIVFGPDWMAQLKPNLACNQGRNRYRPKEKP